jgi:hypothetical protein
VVVPALCGERIQREIIAENHTQKKKKKNYYDICPLNIPSPAKTYTLAPLPTQENLRHTNSSLSPPTPLPLIPLSLSQSLSLSLHSY